MNQIYYETQMKCVAERVNKPIRLVQAIQAHNEEEFIGLTLASIYNEVDKILVIEGAVANRPNSTPDGHSTDKTLEIIKDFKANHDPANKVIVMTIGRPWKNLEEMKQTFLDVSMPGDWLIINDADEFYRPEDIRRLRKAIDLNPHACEFVPNFLHFYSDVFHVAVPGPEWQPQHQRVFKVVRGMKYNSHPVVTDPAGHCTYFSPHYQHRRVMLNDFFIYHYGYARNGMDEIMKQKKEYYDKELVGHNMANKKFDQKVKDWFDGTEPLLVYDGPNPLIDLCKLSPGVPLPKLITSIHKKLNEVGNWKDNVFYSKVLKNEEWGNIWLTMNGLAQPAMSFYHNGMTVC